MPEENEEALATLARIQLQNLKYESETISAFDQKFREAFEKAKRFQRSASEVINIEDYLAKIPKTSTIIQETIMQLVPHMKLLTLEQVISRVAEQVLSIHSNGMIPRVYTSTTSETFQRNLGAVGGVVENRNIQKEVVPHEMLSVKTATNKDILPEFA